MLCGSGNSTAGQRLSIRVRKRERGSIEGDRDGKEEGGYQGRGQG